MKIKSIQIQYLVTVSVECSEPGAFSKQQEFDKQDGKAIKPYLAEKIKESISDAWQYAASVSSVSVKNLKSI